MCILTRTSDSFSDINGLNFCYKSAQTLVLGMVLLLVRLGPIQSAAFQISWLHFSVMCRGGVVSAVVLVCIAYAVPERLSFSLLWSKYSYVLLPIKGYLEQTETNNTTTKRIAHT